MKTYRTVHSQLSGLAPTRRGYRKGCSLHFEKIRWMLYCLLVGSMIVSIAILLAGCLSGSMQRKPEISIVDVRQTLVKALGVEWEAIPSNPAKLHINTPDHDITSAIWVVSDHFRDSKHPRNSIYLEMYVFRNPHVVHLSSSSSWIYMDQPFIPVEWDYQPPHADSFRILCEYRKVEVSGIFCTTEIRYQEYLFYLRAPISSSFGLEDLQALLDVLDDYMVQFLQSSTLVPGPRRVPDYIQ